MSDSNPYLEVWKKMFFSDNNARQVQIWAVEAITWNTWNTGWKHSQNVTWKKAVGLKILKIKQDDLNKQESYKTYMILMISSDGKQNNVFSISVLLPIAILSGFQVTAISLPTNYVKIYTVRKTF